MHSSPPAAVAPAAKLMSDGANRRASRNAIASAKRAPARAIVSHSNGAASPVSDSGTEISAGNGFHAGPATVTRCPWAISLPHTTQAEGS